MDTLPFFGLRQLGLKMALLSPRFNSLVDKHFDGKRELPLLRPIRICKMRKKTKRVATIRNGNSVPFPLPDRPLPNRIRFGNLRIDYIDHSVIAFLHANQQIFDKGTDLRLHVPYPYDANKVQPNWDDFAREIWPIFAQNIRHLNFVDAHHLNNLRLHASPSFLSNLNQLISIDSEDLLPDSIGDDGPNATVGQALSKWLNTPRSDGQPKQLSGFVLSEPPNIKWITNFKEKFLCANSSASYVIRIESFEATEIEGFELMNERTNEKLTLEKEENNNYDEWDELWIMKRCKIGKTIQWEDKKTDNLNNVKFTLSGFGPLSLPKSGKMMAKNHLKMNPGPSGERKK